VYGVCKWGVYGVCMVCVWGVYLNLIKQRANMVKEIEINMTTKIKDKTKPSQARKAKAV